MGKRETTTIKSIVSVFALLLLSIVVKAELVKGKTMGYATIGGEALVELPDSASVFPYEPLYGNWRLVMWVAQVDTGNLINTTTVKPQCTVYDNVNTYKKTTLLKNTNLFITQDYYQPLSNKRLVVLYVFIPDTCIRNDSRVELQFEAVLQAKNKQQWAFFEAYKTKFGFVDAPLVQDKYTLHFLFDNRSPIGQNDFRLLIFSNTKKEIIAVAHEDYRKLKLKYKSKLPLDRKLNIYFIKKLAKSEQELIQSSFINAYQFRDY